MSTEEPVFWHSRPLNLCTELLCSYHLAAMIDAGAGDGNMALACALSRLPYVGMCLTDEHLTLVQERIVSEIMLRMLSSSEPVYEPKLAASCSSLFSLNFDFVFSIVTYKSQRPNFFTIFQRQSRFGRRSSWQVICHVCAARDKHSQQRKWRAHPAAAGGGASGTASGVLNEFRAQLQNLQGNQS